MRFFEFTADNSDKFIILLKNLIGRASSKKAPSTLNWGAISQLSKSTGFEFGADYESFKAMYDSNPAIQKLVKNFNSSGIELKVPGAPGSEEPAQSDQETSQDKVNDIAAGAAAKNLSK
jgi:hypothetical protein